MNKNKIQTKKKQKRNNDKKQNAKNNKKRIWLKANKELKNDYYAEYDK